MRNAQISFIKANMKLATAHTGKSQSAVKAFLNSSSTSDDAVEELATAIGWTEDSNPVGTTMQPTGLTVSSLTVETTTGTAQVPVYQLTVRKIGVVKSNHGILTPCVKFDLNGKTLTAYSDTFRNQAVLDQIKTGDILPIRVDSVKQINGTGRDGKPYTAFTGAILEASVAFMTDARSRAQLLEAKLATLSTDAQSLVRSTQAQREAERFFAEMGI